MGTLGKALHAAGGYVTGSRDLITYLRRAARGFIYSRSVSAIDVASGMAALDIFEGERDELVSTLTSNRTAFVNALNANGLQAPHGPSPIVPIYVGPALAAATAASLCQKRGVFIHPVFPPVVPAGKSILRASMMANHRTNDLVEAASVIAESVAEALETSNAEESI